MNKLGIHIIGIVMFTFKYSRLNLMYDVDIIKIIIIIIVVFVIISVIIIIITLQY